MSDLPQTNTPQTNTPQTNARRAAELPSILIVEDDDTLRLTLADNLEDEGYDVRHAADVQSAAAAIQTQAPDLILLDIMLPDGNGYDFCMQLRRENFKGMVMMLTARTLENDLVTGFEAGADDYLKKPYRLVELLVRVRALLRRVGVTTKAIGDEEALDLAGHQIDAAAHRVVDPLGVEVSLTRTEFDLVQFFVENAGRALTRNEILDAVWGRDVMVDARTVDNFVSSLKKKLAWNASANWAIQTIRGVGYRFEVHAR